MITKPDSKNKQKRYVRSGGRNRSLYSRIATCRALNSYAVFVLFLCCFALVVLALLRQPIVEAANPTAATLTPTSTSVSWQGTATAGGAVGDPVLGFVEAEDPCVEGQTCDTLTLTIGRTAGDSAHGRELVHRHLRSALPNQ